MFAAVSGSCQCVPATDTQVTIWGNNPVVRKEPKPLKLLKGTVITVQGTPLAGTLVEVFPLREAALPGPNSTQRRLLGCVTTKDGDFSFDLPDGRYELRCSKDGGWRATSVLVEIRKKESSQKSLRVSLDLSI
jgi:hypothetical protein